MPRPGTGGKIQSFVSTCSLLIVISCEICDDGLGPVYLGSACNCLGPSFPVIDWLDLVPDSTFQFTNPCVWYSSLVGSSFE